MNSNTAESVTGVEAATARARSRWIRLTAAVRAPQFPQLILLSLALLAAMVASNALYPLQETMQHALRFTDNQIALLQGPAATLPVVIAAIPTGLLIDRYCRVRLLLLFAALAIAGDLATALAQNLPTLMICQGLVQVMMNATWMTMLSLLADLYSPAQRGRALAVTAIFERAGISLAFMMGGWFLAGHLPAPNAWRWALANITLLLVPLMLLIVPMREPTRGPSVRNDKPLLREVCQGLWRYRGVIAVLSLSRIMLAIGDNAALVWASPVFTRDFGLPPDQVGAMVGTALLIAGLASPVVAGLLTDWCQRMGGPRRSIAALMFVSLLSAPAGLFALAATPLLGAALLCLLIFIGSTVFIVTASVATVALPVELRGASIGVMTSAGYLLGVAPAPLTVSLLSGQLGGPAMLGEALAIVCIVTSLLGVAIFAVGRHAFRSQQ